MQYFRKKIGIKYKSIICIFFAIYALYIQNPYFTWSTYNSGIFGSIGGFQISTAIGILCVILSFFYLSKNKIRLKRKDKILSLMIVIIAFVNINISSDFRDTFSGLWISYFVLLLFYLLPMDFKVLSYNYFRWIIIISLIIPIIIFILSVLGVSVPFSELQSYESIKQHIGVSYRHYPFAVTRVQLYQIELYSLKLCGIFDEPGRIGTLCGLLLVSEQFNFKGRKANWILFLAGIMTFSMAFYFLIAIYFFVNGVFNKQKGIIIILGLLICYFAFITIPFSNPDIVQFQNRFKIVNGVLSGNNRTNQAYMNLFYDGFTKNIKNLLLGQGAGSLARLQNLNNIDGSSFQSLLYDYGICGFIAHIIWVIYYCYNKRSLLIYCMPICFAHLANTLQRPYMFSFTYMLILIGGIEMVYLEYSSKKIPQNTREN